MPVKVTVTENPTREVGLAVGYGTDDGARAEVAYRDRNFLERGFDLQSSLRVGQERQIGYADVYFPPGLFARCRAAARCRSATAWACWSSTATIENLRLSRFAIAGYRHFKLEARELRAGLSYQIERRRPDGADESASRAPSRRSWRSRGAPSTTSSIPSVAACSTCRRPRRTTACCPRRLREALRAVPALVPVLARDDQLLLRTEIGSTVADSRAGIPEDFLFRAGGSRSNRGYAYQSLGVREGDAVVGGRYIATGSVEYVRWFRPPSAARRSSSTWATRPIRRGDWDRAIPATASAHASRRPRARSRSTSPTRSATSRFRLSFSVTVAF